MFIIGQFWSRINMILPDWKRSTHYTTTYVIYCNICIFVHSKQQQFGLSNHHKYFFFCRAYSISIKSRLCETTFIAKQLILSSKDCFTEIVNKVHLKNMMLCRWKRLTPVYVIAIKNVQLMDNGEIHISLEICFGLFTKKAFDMTDIRLQVFRKPTQVNACGIYQVM